MANQDERRNHGKNPAWRDAVSAAATAVAAARGAAMKLLARRRPPGIAVGLAMSMACVIAGPPAADAQPPPGSPGSGVIVALDEPATLAVLPLGLADQLRRRFPELAVRATGLGIHGLLSRDLAATGRFRLVTARSEVVEELVNRNWVASSGAADLEAAMRYGELLGARYVVWGELYDFGSRKVKRKTFETGVAVQLRLVDVATGATASAAASGTAVLKGQAFPLAFAPDFAASPVGAAAAAAFAEAVPQLLARIPDLAAARR